MLFILWCYIQTLVHLMHDLHFPMFSFVTNSQFPILALAGFHIETIYFKFEEHVYFQA